MKKISLLILLSLSIMRVWAYDFSYGEGYWDKYYFNILSEEDHTVELTKGQSRYYFSNMVVPAEVVDYDSITYQVVAIGEYALSNSPYLSTVVLPESVDSIKTRAFMGCPLESINIPASVSYIALDAFEDCNDLKTINIAEGNTQYAFEDGVLFSKDKTRLLVFLNSMKEKLYSIPEGVQAISPYAFSYNDNLQVVHIPSSVVEIDSCAFFGCSSLLELIIDNGSKLRLDHHAVFECSCFYAIQFLGNLPPAMSDTAVASEYLLVDVPAAQLESYKTSLAPSLPNSTFRGYFTSSDAADPLLYWSNGAGTVSVISCIESDATALVVPSTVTYQGTTYSVVRAERTAFVGLKCKSITIPATMTEIAVASWSETEFEGFAFMHCPNLESIQVAEGNTRYSSRDGILYSVGGDTLLVYPVNRPDSSYTETTAQVIQSRAFLFTKYLKTLRLPDSFTTICSDAFIHCPSLSEVHFGSGIREIKRDAFWAEYTDTYLGIYFYFTNRTSVPYIAGAFGSCDIFYCLNVPLGCKQFYLDAQITLSEGEDPVNAGWSDYQYNVYDTYNADGTEAGSFPYALVSYEDRTVKIIREYNQYSGDITVPAKVMVNGVEYSVVRIDDEVFEYKDLGHVVLPSTLQSIGKRAFYYCDMKSINLPESLTEIGEEAFRGAEMSGTIVLPANLKLIDGSVFGGSTVESFEVAEGNTEMQAIEGLLYNLPGEGDSLTLISCPAGYEGDLELPDSVRAIGPNAFTECNNLTSVKTAAGYFGENAFCDCENIKTIDLLSPDRLGGHLCYGEYFPERIFIRTLDKIAYTDSTTRVFDVNYWWRDMGDMMIYLPGEMVASYKADSAHWENVFNRFIGMIDYMAFDDNEAFVSPDSVPMLINNLEVTLNFKNTNWRSSMLRFPVSQSVLEENGILASELRYVDEGASNVIMLNFARVLSGETLPDHPLLLKSNAGEGSVTFTLHDVETSNGNTVNVEYDIPNYKVTFVGKTTSVSGDFLFANNAYVVGQGRLSTVSDNTVNMGPNRWYMTYQSKNQMSAPTFRVGFVDADEEATAISALQQTPASEAPLYDLRGNRVNSSHLTPGLYVREGKKLLCF